MIDRIRNVLVPTLAVLLCLYTLAEVNMPRLTNQGELAIFVMLGLMLCFLTQPISPKWKDNTALRWLDLVLTGCTVLACGYVFVQSEPLFSSWWSGGLSLGDRSGIETRTDFYMGILGLLLVLESTRRTIGWTVPILSTLFMLHSWYAYLSYHHGWPAMPAWLLPHAGQNLEYLVSVTWSQSLGIFGVAAGVMFKYVFLFVIFGSFLEMSGATQFIIAFAERIFGRSPGGPAKVAVLGSGLMGSLSGSAVANAVTTGSFTIPMMRNAGFSPAIAGGITAAAASGGALVPPVMGAGAYMMIELVRPQIQFLDVARAALIPAILYYLSILMLVHFYSRRVGSAVRAPDEQPAKVDAYQGLVFFASLGVLIVLLVMGFSPFTAVTGSLVVILLLNFANPASTLPAAARWSAIAAFFVVTIAHRIAMGPPPVPGMRTWLQKSIESSVVGMLAMILFALIHPVLRKPVLTALVKSARGGISLVAASACVGIIIGVVQQTGVASDFSAAISQVIESNLLLALLGIMFCSLILGMGVPSVVCYLLMVTLMGTVLEQLGVQPLASHLFIFYFGMMSMVTPPVALAAYASASIANAKIMTTALAAFRFSLVGFLLPFMFVYRPSLLLLEKLDPENKAGTANKVLNLANTSNLIELGIACGTAVLGVLALSACVAGYLAAKLSPLSRLLLFVAAMSLFSPDLYIGGNNYGPPMNISAVVVLIAVWIGNATVGKRLAEAAAPAGGEQAGEQAGGTS